MGNNLYEPVDFTKNFDQQFEIEKKNNPTIYQEQFGFTEQLTQKLISIKLSNKFSVGLTD